jgi:uncharacterized phosphosugar-binding protein
MPKPIKRTGKRSINGAMVVIDDDVVDAVLEYARCELRLASPTLRAVVASLLRRSLEAAGYLDPPQRSTRHEPREPQAQS